ncbi:MAG: FdtA/QdtA family cupin domain-containing protein [Butyrivibrio sp.]|nr:FdtA/QdtA family cupin domain-containing protein [Butyrivibrio sp.]
MSKEKYRVIEFKEYGDERGNLVVAEGSGRDIPFEIKRVFYMYGSDDQVVRGQHANRVTEFVLINVAGSSEVLVDDGEKKEVIKLDKPRMGLYLSNMVWKEMYNFSPDSVLIVLASEHYQESEYIRDYDEFIKEVKATNE